MPAIRYLNGNTPKIVTHYRGSPNESIQASPSPGRLIVPNWYGFICNSGASHLKGGKIARLVVNAVSAGDGSIEDEWVVIPMGHFALGWWIPGKGYLYDSGDLYGLVDDFGWPMTTLRYGDHPRMVK